MIVIALVVSWNGWRDTLDCVQSILGAQRLPEHVLICDNGSMDGSVQALEAWFSEKGFAYTSFPSPEALLAGEPLRTRIGIVEIGENLGYAGANNLGMRYALERCKADYVWILNNDVVVGSQALRRMLELAQSDDAIGIVGAKLLRYDAPETIQAMGGGFIIPVICHDTQLGHGRASTSFDDTPIRLDHLIGACLLVRSTAIRRVGFIDESYFLYREETDWCIRMRRHGWKLYCCATAEVWHKQSRSSGFRSQLHDYYAVRNMLRLVRKFYPTYLPTAFAYFATRALAPKLLRLEFARIEAVLQALRDFALGIGGRASAHTDEVLFDQYLGRGENLIEGGRDAGGGKAGGEPTRSGRETRPR